MFLPSILAEAGFPNPFPAFQFLATDSLTQGHAPSDVNGEPVNTAKFHTDLTRLAGEKPTPVAGCKLFCFKGYALADLALANLVLKLAKERGGIELPR